MHNRRTPHSRLDRTLIPSFSKPSGGAVLLRFLCALSFGLGFMTIHAATVWNGPTITFTKTDGSDPTAAANQDRLTANVWLTRGGAQGIYNAKQEAGFTHNVSP